MPIFQSQWPRFLTILGLGSPLTAILLAAMFGDGSLDIDAQDIPSYEEIFQFNVVGVLVFGFFLFLTYLFGEIFVGVGSYLRVLIFRDSSNQNSFAKAAACNSTIVERDLIEMKSAVELFDGAACQSFLWGLAWPLIPGGHILIWEWAIVILAGVFVGLAFLAVGSRRVDAHAKKIEAAFTALNK